jgi:hypothetical protein
MTWTMLIIAIAVNGGISVTAPVGSYSSLNACETEKALVEQRLAVAPANATGPMFGTKLVCVRKT